MTVGRLLRLTSKNVFTNLAAEEQLFQRSANKSLIFYVNSECAVLGRTQNPFKEVDVNYAAANGIPIARRRSGGGTVVHDEGNLNFCFVRPREEHEPLSNAKLVASVLREEFGIKAVVNERADIVVDGMKVSGAAYRISRDRAYHHGTLLINSNLDRLRRLLRSPQNENLTAMGTQSIRSPVTNLSEHYSGVMDTSTVIDAIAERFLRTNAFVVPVSPTQVERDCGGMQAERGELCSHAWVYGKTPRFSYDYRIDGALVKLDIAKGATVSGVSVEKVAGDQGAQPDPGLAPFLTDCLVGQPFDGKLLARRIRTATLPRAASVDNQMQECLARALQVDIPGQFWREEGEVPFQAYN